MRLRILYFVFPIFTGLLLVGCYPDGPEYTSDYNLVGSAYDPEFSFDGATTFVLPDTIVFIKDENDNKTYLTDDQEQQIVDNVRNNLAAMGWIDSTNAAVDTMPDVILTITGIATKYSGSYWNYWGWYGGWGWYYPGYPGWGYPWYPGGGYPSYYEYTTGSLIIDMIDWRSASLDDDYPPFVWAGALNGLINRTPVDVSKINLAVDKMFELSPYLDKTN
jgi:hypothetical protein